MTAQECISSAKKRIFENWISRSEEKLQSKFGNSKAVLIDVAPDLLNHLDSMLKQVNSTANNFACKSFISNCGVEKLKTAHHTLNQIHFEICFLQETVFALLAECKVSVTVEEARIISLCFHGAVSSISSAFVEAIDKVREGSETQFNLFMKEATDYAIFMLNTDGKILSWNAGAERMKQYTPEEAIGQHLRMLYREEDQKVGRAERNLEFAIKKGRYEEQWWRKKKDGTLFWADAIMTPIYSSGGKITGLSKIVRDLSAKKRIEDELSAAKAFAAEASCLKSIFVAKMSHEIRTPLNSILGFSDVLKDPSCSAHNRVVAADIIDRNGKVLLRLIDDILDIAKLEAGKMQIEVSQISPRVLINEVIEVFAAQGRSKGLVLKLVVNDNVMDPILSDAIRLRQVLYNIIGNAVKFTERGEVTVEVHADADCKGIEVVVTDTGKGLTSVERRSLFKSFTQADNTVTRKFGGTGLGLALSRRLMEALGGSLDLLDFEKGKGCAFRIIIPNLSEDFLQKNESMATVSLLERPDKEGSANISDMNILVVDDSPDNQDLLKAFLDKWNIHSDMARNGFEGVKMALHGDYNLILMDIQMPVMDGNEAIRVLRSSGYKRPIVVITAHAMNDEKAKAFDSGCDDFLVKPIDKVRLRDMIEAYAPPPKRFELTRI